MKQIRVFRNPHSPTRSTKPWLVSCGLCSGGGFFAVLWAASARWWAPTWEVAQGFATAHARDHEATRCPSCLHLPERQLSPEETHAR